MKNAQSYKNNSYTSDLVYEIKTAKGTYVHKQNCKISYTSETI